MNFWIISDTHFGHSNIIDYCNRPVHHESTLLSNIYGLPPKDVLIHLGDFAFKDDIFWHRQLFDIDIPVKGWLVIGNHDKHTMSWYLQQGWQFVGHSFSLRVFGFSVLFTHRPAPYCDHDLNIHGHLHNTEHRPNFLSEKHVLYAPENENYEPVKLSKLIERWRSRK